MQTATGMGDHPLGTPLGRIALLGLPLSATLFAAFWLTGLPGYRLGWLSAPAVAGVALGAFGWLAWGRQGGRVAAATVLAAVGIVGGRWFADNSILSEGVLRAELNALPLEYDVADESASGNALCFSVCTQLGRTWIVPGDVEAARAEFGERLRSEGFVLGPWKPEIWGQNGVMAKGHRGRLAARVSVVDSPYTWVGRERLPIPPGHVEVTVLLGTYMGES